jgi:hypothetical protein
VEEALVTPAKLLPPALEPVADQTKLVLSRDDHPRSEKDHPGNSSTTDRG